MMMMMMMMIYYNQSKHGRPLGPPCLDPVRRRNSVRRFHHTAHFLRASDPLPVGWTVNFHQFLNDKKHQKAFRNPDWISTFSLPRPLTDALCPHMVSAVAAACCKHYLPEKPAIMKSTPAASRCLKAMDPSLAKMMSGAFAPFPTFPNRKLFFSFCSLVSPALGFFCPLGSF
jgi:hypothetical protein